MMRIPGLGRLRSAAGRVRNRLSPGVLILLYHRVTTLDRDPQLLAVSPGNFDEQMAMIRQNWEVISLKQAAAAVRVGTLPQRAVVVTFDDGYADNFLIAKPILEKHAVPATVFVASGFVGSEREFFWDELDRLLLSGEGRSDWNVLCEETASRAQLRYRRLCAGASEMDHSSQNLLLERVRARLKLGAQGRASHRAASAEMLQSQAKNGLIEIGAHTVFHPRLSCLGEEQQVEEIVASKRQLEDLLGQPVVSFSYPFGGPADYSEASVRIVKQAGFECACTNFGGSVRRGSDPFQLNRVLVRNWSAEELRGRILRWFDE